jgi:Integrase core domain.
MPWETKTVEKSREEFVTRALALEASKTKLCREYGISRPTGDKWIARYQRGESLRDQSRAPFHTPIKTKPEMEAKILSLRQRHPAMGATKIKRMLENNGEHEVPNRSTVNEILKRNGCITKEASKTATPYQRFVKSAPNDMWQTDFKGDFKMSNGKRCHPLTVLDDHSRYNLCLDAKDNERLAGVVESFTNIFYEYGMPKILLCDNGNPWGTSQTSGITRFDVWMMDLGILTIHITPHHPQTQGKDERFNGTLKKELLKYVEIKDYSDAQNHFNMFSNFYNNERPHFALELDVPAKHYKPSEIKFPDKIEHWEYPAGYESRTIKTTGYFTYGGEGYFVSEGLADKTLGIRPSSLPGCINLYYRQFRVARINLDERAVVSRRIYLTDGDPRLEPAQK